MASESLDLHGVTETGSWPGNFKEDLIWRGLAGAKYQIPANFMGIGV